jgi:hypothetical protein
MAGMNRRFDTSSPTLSCRVIHHPRIENGRLAFGWVGSGQVGSGQVTHLEEVGCLAEDVCTVQYGMYVHTVSTVRTRYV